MWFAEYGRSGDQKPSEKLDPFTQYEDLKQCIVELRRQHDSLGDPPSETQALAVWTAKEHRLSSKLNALVMQQNIFLEAVLKRGEEERRGAERRMKAADAGAPTNLACSRHLVNLGRQRMSFGPPCLRLKRGCSRLS